MAGQGAKPGPRVRPGRPLGSVAAKHQITAKQIGFSDYYPLEYMLALMRDEDAEPQRRDAMAIQAAPFCHAKLNAITTASSKSASNNAELNIVQIFSVPRGAALDLKAGTVSIEGNDSLDLKPVEPYEPTPALRTTEPPATPQEGPSDRGPAVQAPHSEPLPIIELDTDNITRLDTYRDKPE